MNDYKKVLKEKRQESDKRIIDSAVKSFGRNGYTYSSIRDIAKSAGITSGLITQRYGTKDNLFLEAYKQATAGLFTEVDIKTSPRDCLTSIIKDIEKLCDNNPDAFALCNMLFTATDYPKDILTPYREQLKKANAYSILKEAQKKGMLPEGNLDILLSSFSAMVFHNVNLCKRYNLEYSAPEEILNFIHFEDSITKRENKWHRILETAIANTFDLLVYANLAENKGEILQCSDMFSVLSDSADARAEIEETIKQVASEEEQPRLREYLNLDTLSDRLKGRKSISLKMTDIKGRIMVHTFLPLSWDENGNLAEVFAGIYRVKPDGKPEQREI